MTQTALAEFLFTSSTASIQAQLIEIYHPDFTQTYRIIKNKLTTADTILVAHDEITAPVPYTYYPVDIKSLGTTNSLDQRLEVTFGDLGQILPQEVARLRRRNGSRIKPTLSYREYDSSVIGDAPTQFQWIFDGTDDNMAMGNVAAMSPTATTPFSVGAWYTGTDPTGPIFSKMQLFPFARGWTIFAVGGKAYHGLFSTDTPDVGLQGVGGDTINDGTRHFILATYDGSTNLSGFKLYVDNNLQSLSAPVDNLLAADNVQTTDPVQIGTRDVSEFLAGIIEHCQFWDKELSGGERGEVYNGGVPPDLTTVSCAADLVSWYKVNYDEGDIPGTDGIQDFSGNGHHGTATFNPTGSADIPALTGLIYGPFEMEINSINFNKTGAIFTARPQQLNRTRVGELYDPGRFPMMKGFL